MSPASAKQRSRRNQNGLAGFARFLRQYAKAWPALLACVIAPIFRYLKLLPMYKAHEGLALGIVSVYGFLLAVAIFYYRPAFLRSRKGSGLLPAVMLVLSFVSIILYLVAINRSIRMETDFAISVGVAASELIPGEILARTALENIPLSASLIASYLLAFFGAETALVIFALREYTHSQASRGK